MKTSVRRYKRLAVQKPLLCFPTKVPVYAFKACLVNPLFRLAHYSLFSRTVRIKLN